MAISAATVTRLRSRFDSSWRSQISPKSTRSVSSTSLGAKSPIIFSAAEGSLLIFITSYQRRLFDAHTPSRGAEIIAQPAARARDGDYFSFDIFAHGVHSRMPLLRDRSFFRGFQGTAPLGS